MVSTWKGELKSRLRRQVRKGVAWNEEQAVSGLPLITYLRTTAVSRLGGTMEHVSTRPNDQVSHALR